ncbi:MAG: FAD-binding oxidoreductase, partial [Myxococcales bacterium]
MRGLEGGATEVVGDAIAALGTRLAGDLLRPGDPGYDEARTLWNAMIDRHPALVARCMSAADVAEVVKFARQHGVLLSIRGAGHNIAGNAVCEGGVTIDLSRLRGVTVDAATRRVSVEPGATLGDLDAATAKHGLAVPTGINSTTGVAGLTLGGGFGWLSRSLGLTVDRLRAAEVVLASGEIVTANESEHSELFWGLRGGGGNFGVVTRFDFEAAEVGPNLLSGLIVHPFAEASTVLDFYRRFSADASDELTVWSVLRQAPPLPFLPEPVHGQEVVVLALCWAGDPEAGERAVAPLVEFGAPHGSHVGVQPFTAWQQAFDPLLTPGARNYWKSHNFVELADGLLEVLIDAVGSLPTPATEVFLGQLGGAQARVAADATAYPHRDARYVMNVHTRWDAAADDARCIAWARKLFAAAEPFATGGVYTNFMPDDEADRVRG